MGQESRARQTDSFRYRLSLDSSAPLLDNCLPGQAHRDLLENVGYQDACSGERRLAMTHGRIDDNESTERHALIGWLRHRLQPQNSASWHTKSQLSAGSALLCAWIVPDRS